MFWPLFDLKKQETNVISFLLTMSYLSRHALVRGMQWVCDAPWERGSFLGCHAVKPRDERCEVVYTAKMAL